MKSGTSIIPPAVVAALPKLPHSALKLAAVIGKYANQQGECWPAVRTLMKDAGIGDWRTFQAARKSLKVYGLTWKTGTGRQSCRYKWTSVAPVTSTGTKDGVVSGITTGAKKNKKSVAPVTITDDAPVAITDRTPHRTPQEDKEAQKKKPKTAKIAFDREAVLFTGITDETFDRWTRTYPLVNIEHEIAAAGEWLADNPDRQKSNYHRFLTNWFNRTQDQATKSGKSGPVEGTEEWWAERESHLQETFDKPHKIGKYAEMAK